MPAVNIPLYGCPYTFYVPGVISVADTLSFQITPTIAAGDFKRKIDGAALANFTNIPVVDNTGETAIKFVCTATEMTCDNLPWRGVDQTSPKEWMDCGDVIQPRGLPGSFDWGTAQSVTGTTLVMKSAATYADNELIGCIVHIVNATTGIGQTRAVLSNVGSTDTLTLDAAWQTTPTGTIIYNLFPAPGAPTVAPSVQLTSAERITTVNAIRDDAIKMLEDGIDRPLDTGTAHVKDSAGATHNITVVADATAKPLISAT